jgi:hypothetical protein
MTELSVGNLKVFHAKGKPYVICDVEWTGPLKSAATRDIGDMIDEWKNLLLHIKDVSPYVEVPITSAPRSDLVALQAVGFRKRQPDSTFAFLEMKPRSIFFGSTLPINLI